MSGMRVLLAVAFGLTLGAVIIWLATGAHPYTKYRDVTREELPVDGNDPFAETGFYDGDAVTATVKKDVFYFGLLPVPRGVFDRHAVSVMSVVVPAWIIVGGAALLRRRSMRTRRNPLNLTRTSSDASDPFPT